ncbi:MAG: nucleotide exchange factor GrpE [Candidatus Krumholzibacteria bacterium]|nr:nucleotide exchange factor GrpE [Candidatus Krumholzibacteria bacterium]
MSKPEKNEEKLAAEKASQAAGDVQPEAASADEEIEALAAEVMEFAPEPDPLADMTAERDEFKEKWLRLVAEMDNLRKRSSRELVQSRKFAQADVLRSFLEVQDNFERALQSVSAEADTDAPDSFRQGVEMIHQKINGVLKEKGVTPLEALDATFDPNFHDAVGQLPREGVESGIVIEVVQQGYNFGDMVLRPARVIISA